MIEAVCGYKDSLGEFHDSKESAIKADIRDFIMRGTKEAWCQRYYPNESLVIHVNITADDVAEFVAENLESIIEMHDIAYTSL